MGALAEILGAGYEAMFSIPHAYSRKEIVDADGKQWLKIHLGKNFLLPLVDIGSSENSIAIGWFSPDPAINPELSHAAARALAKYFEKAKSRRIVAPPSSKSGPLIAEAAWYAGHIPVITLLGGDSRGEVEQFSSEPAVEYYPVTRLASGKPKFLGIKREMRSDIMKHTPNGFYLTMADDVCTTANTIHAMEQLLQVEHHQIAVVAKESSLDSGYPPRLPANMRASLFLPEITGLDKSKLWPIAQRELIPPARIVR